MGFESESVELEPAPEDLLTCWGHEVSAKNLELFFPNNVDLQGFSEEVVVGGLQNGTGLLEEILQSTWSGRWRAVLIPAPSQDQNHLLEDGERTLQQFSRPFPSYAAQEN